MGRTEIGAERNGARLVLQRGRGGEERECPKVGRKGRVREGLDAERVPAAVIPTEGEAGDVHSAARQPTPVILTCGVPHCSGEEWRGERRSRAELSGEEHSGASLMSLMPRISRHSRL